MSRALLALVLASALAACGQPPGPRDYEPGTACARCKMLIDRRETVAQIVDDNGNASYFDDLQCFLAALASNPAALAHGDNYVTDRDRLVWTRATDARFCKSTEVTPMGSGLVAFTGETKPAGCVSAEVYDLARALAAFAAEGAAK